MDRIRIASRASALAIKQSEMVRDAIVATCPHFWGRVEIIPITSSGDKMLETPLWQAGGKGLFIKEIEDALLGDAADIAVHSFKDMPVDITSGTQIAAVLPRDNPYDCMVSNKYNALMELPEGAVVGTSSVRRKIQLMQARPDLQVMDVRGNVNTRLQKLDDGNFDAIILAAAGLERLSLHNRITEILSSDVFIPAIAQGVIAIQCRQNDEAMQMLLAAISCGRTHEAANAERYIMKHLGGDCRTPIAGHVVRDGDCVSVKAMYSDMQGISVNYAYRFGFAGELHELVKEVSAELMPQ